MKKCICSINPYTDIKKLLLQSKGYWKTYITFNSNSIIDKLKTKHYDFILFDIEVSGSFPIETIKNINKQFPNIPVFLFSQTKNNNTIQTVLKYKIKKVFVLPEEEFLIFKFIENFFKRKSDKLCKINTKENFSSLHDILKKQIIGKSEACESLRSFVYTAANSLLPVLLLGETGCGKDLAAKLIHELSFVKNGKFITVNVNTIPESLAESILFGTEKGSFTGAENKNGLFLEANEGTLFLNEMESLNLNMQAKLLDVLESKSVRAVGSSKTKRTEFRLICASNVNLKKMVKQNKFRKDLYYRLDVLRYKIPPLRKRKEDILSLADFYLCKLKKEISADALNKLYLYNWPGNVRELFNCLERAACFSEDEKTIKYRHIEF